MGVTGGDEHHRVATADDDGAIGLLGQLAGFDGQGTGPEGDFSTVSGWDHGY